MKNKVLLRQRMRELLQQLPAAVQSAGSDAVCRYVSALPQYRRAERIMAFLHMPGEVSLDALIAAAVAAGKEVYVPRCLGPGLMEAARLPSLAAAVSGAYGIRTAPPDSPAVAATSLDLILVSGLAFDAAGHRLGRGAGFYDRYLQPLRRDVSIAVAWQAQSVAAVPTEAHDVPMSLIVTEEGCHHI